MTFSFVDIETTGTSARHDRVIEIGILRVENDRIVKKYNQLINPETHVSSFITQITGITPDDLADAPTFEIVKDEVYELLQDSIFVAHNVRFDHGFLKNEFKRHDMNLAAKQLCTVKLSRKLFPQHRHHNLDAIIERFHIRCKNRHRAYDDADAIWQFFKKVSKLIPQEELTQILDRQIKRPSIPARINTHLIDALPEGPGVYKFYGENEVPLYIGKSKNIRKRVLSHFTADHRYEKDMNISRQLKRIETISTAGELGALLKESALIKKEKPFYNKALRYKKNVILLLKEETTDGYKTVQMQTRKQICVGDLKNLLGVYNSKKQAREFLKEQATNYHLCEKILGLESSKGSCFGYKIEKCKGACMGKERALRYNIRFIEAFGKDKIKSWPFEGAITIYEHDSIEKITDTIHANQWCLITSDNDPLIFDYDIYKILLRYFQRHIIGSHFSITKKMPDQKTG